MQEKFAIGIDVGGSSLKCGVVNRNGEIVHSFLQSLEEVSTEEEVITAIADAVSRCAMAVNNSVEGIGIGFPGIVDQNVVIGGADNLPGFNNLPLAQIIEAKTGYPVWIDNDANMMGYGELKYGAASDSENIVFLTVGTGIGGAILIDGKIFGGHQNRGAELGHIIINHGGKPCSCGAKGCFEAYASILALIEDFRDAGGTVAAGNQITGRSIVAKYHEGNPIAKATLQQHFDYMATGIASFINVFSPQKVVIGGGISEAGSFYIDEIKTRVLRLAMPAAAQFTNIVAATLGNKAGLLGCAAKVFDHVKN